MTFSESSSLVVTATQQLPEKIQDMVVNHNGLLYVSAGYSGVYLLDPVNQDNALLWRKKLDTPGFAGDMELVSLTLYVADGAAFVQAIEQFCSLDE